MNPPSTDRHEPDTRLRWLVRSAVIAPVVVAVARALATGWFPVGDSALLAIRAYDVGTSHHPLLGSWTSASLTLGVDVNNPGPLYADLLAPWMWTVGRWAGIGPATALGVGSVNAAFAALTAWVAHRIGGWRVERWALLMVAALMWSMGSELLIDIWQPHALLLPFLSVLILTVALLVGRWELLPVWVGVVSLIVQTHLGYAYVLIVLALVVATAGALALRRSQLAVGELVRGRIPLAAAAVAALAWLQPLIEQVAGPGRGNLARLLRNASGGDVTIGAGTAVRLVARIVALPPWWTRPGFEDAVESTPLTERGGEAVLDVPGLPSGPVAAVAVAIVVSLLAGAWWLARRHGRTDAAAALLVASVGVVTAVVTLTIQTVSVVGLGSHHVRWLWVLALFVQVSLAWAAVEIASVSTDISTPATPVLVAAVLGLTVANLPKTAHDLGPTADRAAADTLARTFDDLADFRPGGPVRYAVDDLRPFEPWSSAVQMRLRELGIDFRVDDGGVVRQLGEDRRADGSEVTTIRQVERGAAVRGDDAWCEISRASPLDPTDTAVVDALIGDAVADVASGRVELTLDGLDPDLVARFGRALAGDADEAFVLVADGLLPFLAAEGRIVTATEAVERAIADADRIERRVVGTLVLVVDPPVGPGCR